MPELRTDWLTGRTVLVAENRALRPNEFSGGGSAIVDRSKAADGVTTTESAGCPFCAGNEHRTPTAVYERRDDAGRWQVRVVPNAYAAVENLSGQSVGDASAMVDAGSHSVSSAIGVHEVVIENPSHIERMSALSTQELRHVLEAYRQRLLHWQSDGRLQYAILFKNQGPRAGASLGHIHSQLIALPFVPTAVRGELTRAAEQRAKTTRCAYCDLIASERAAGERVVWERHGFMAFCPLASWQPREVWVMPTEHDSSFESSGPVALDRLACLLRELFGRLESIPGSTQYNMLLRTAPWTGEFGETFHWRIELLPRENSFAGCEVATAIHINPLAPEHAAKQLRGM